ncbi:MAG: 4-hydroxy-tetrahydrodipicolinate reductase [Kiritimatiellaeota bacterium]|nr:4-hydroxy-tetrahydrodipicolinate reductase [Kiritimatiellota bacterium]
MSTVIVGAAGRMGRLLTAAVLDNPDFDLTGAVEVPGSPAIGMDAGTLARQSPCGVAVAAELAPAVNAADVLIEFAAPDCVTDHARTAAAAECALVIGTTGFAAADRQALEDLAANGARILLAPNMSVGVNLLFYLCEKVVPILGSDYDIEVVEMHHNRKKDAPSGTAVRLGEILAEAAGLPWPQSARFGRQGQVGERTRSEIGMHAVRGGDAVGDHTVILAAQGERIELTHRASSRETFVQGALRAARFIVDAAPGLYDMQDVLGLRDADTPRQRLPH